MGDSFELLQKASSCNQTAAARKFFTNQVSASRKHPVRKGLQDHVLEALPVQALQSSANLREPGERGLVLDEPPDDVPEAPVEVDKQNECASVTLRMLNRHQKLKIQVSDKCAEEGWAL